MFVIDPIREWFTQQGDNSTQRKNFFRDYFRIMLSVARIPLPVIGSFIIDSNGFLQLKNRPLTLEAQDLENEEIPTNIPRDYTYDTVDSYVTDVLGMHDSCIQHQPNAINVNDSIYQISALAAVRATFPTFIRRELRRRPFVFVLTDLHQSNVLVDRDWNIPSIVDLEWGCSQPIEVIQPPYWLTDESVDLMRAAEYDQIR